MLKHVRDKTFSCQFTVFFFSPFQYVPCRKGRDSIEADSQEKGVPRQPTVLVVEDELGP